MDANRVKLIAHFNVLFAKETGGQIDLIRFSDDKRYAKQILEIAATSVNKELVVIALQLMDLRGLFPKSPK
jgi:hypothetical protein